jgi:hypothetical protein
MWLNASSQELTIQGERASFDSWFLGSLNKLGSSIINLF